jgi:hypothetical protein
MNVLRALACLWMAALASDAGAQAFNSALAKIMDELSRSATKERHAQIVDAVRASPSLTQALNRSAANGKLTAVRVVERERLPAKKAARFGGMIDGGAILFTPQFLQAQLGPRMFDVRYDDDIEPDNTAFALAHLAHHIANEQAVIKAMASSPSSEAWIQKRLEHEAEAFILGWNAMLEAARRANAGRDLSERQITQLLMNTRYRFAFAPALDLPEKLRFTPPSGRIDMDERNIKAIARVLATSNLPDIE